MPPQKNSKSMSNKIGHKASIPNPALKQLKTLIGMWETTGTHPYLPNKTLHGRASFEWLEGGAFIIMHAEIDDPNFPAGVAIFGSDDSTQRYYMLYFDERGVSRKYNLSISGKKLKWWRNDPEFSQRFNITISDDGLTMVSKGEMSKNGSQWEKDLDLTYKRVE